MALWCTCVWCARNLNDNDIFGSIPAALGKMPSLAHLCVTVAMPGRLWHPLSHVCHCGHSHVLAQRRGQLRLDRNHTRVHRRADQPSVLVRDSNKPTRVGCLTVRICVRVVSMGMHSVASGNSLSGEIPASIGRLNRLDNVRLNDNSLDGTIPPSLGNMSSLSNLFLSNNKLQGTIPDTFGQLANLTILLASNNQLNGTVPPSLLQLPKLGTVTLSSNRLSGDLLSLGAVSDTVSTLDISNNQLCGPMPLALAALLGIRFEQTNGVPTTLYVTVVTMFLAPVAAPVALTPPCARVLARATTTASWTAMPSICRQAARHKYGSFARCEVPCARCCLRRHRTTTHRGATR